MKKHTPHSLIILLTFFVSTFISAQTTYTWNVSSGDWSAASSWSPSRSSPSPSDILVFNGSVISSPTVTNITKDSIGKLRFINNVQAIFASGVATTGVGTITRSGTSVTGSGTQFLNQLITGDGFYHGVGSGFGEVVGIASNTSMTCTVSSTVTGVTWSIRPRISIMSTSAPALDVQSGSSLTISAGNPKALVFFLGTGVKALISGTIYLTNGSHKFMAIDSNAIVFKNGGTLNISDGYSGTPFGTIGNSNIVTFDTGSTYFTNSTITPFGLAAPASLVYFAHGSSYIHKNPTYGSDMFDGRTYDRFTIDTIDFNETTIDIPNGCTIDTFIVNNATNVGFDGSSTGLLKINGSLIINNGTFSIGQGTASKELRFFGTNVVNGIIGSGTISLGSNATVTINNPVGLKLFRNLLVGGTLNMTQGNILLNNDTLTLGTASSHIGTLNYTPGYMIGPGAFRKWFNTTSVSIGTNAGLFPMGSGTSNRSFWIAGTPSSAGIVAVSHNNIIGATTFSTPFSDNATNAVTVNVRQNSNWIVSIASGFAGSSFSLRVQGNAASSEVTNTTNLRLTLGTGIAPGTAADGGGTNSLPQANRTAITAANLNNTFYIGGNSSQNPLPVKLLNFTASTNDNRNISIEWSSSSEINSDRYELEKSLDGNLFAKIKTIKINESSFTQKNYSLLDMNAFSLSDNIYYRLKMIDKDGSTEISNIVEISKRGNQQSTILASPNPTNGLLKLSIVSNQNQVSKIDLVDLNGKIVYTTNGNFSIGENELNIDMEPLKNGIYFIRFINSEEAKILKIIKN